MTTRLAIQCPVDGPTILDEAKIQIRGTSDGVVSNTRTLMNSAGNIPSGIINISKCPGFLLIANPTWASLTDLYFDFEFGYEATSGTFVFHKPMLASTFTSPRCVLVPIIYHIAAAVGTHVCWWVPNPGAPFMRGYVQSVGVTTASALYVDIIRTLYTPSDNCQNVL